MYSQISSILLFRSDLIIDRDLEHLKNLASLKSLNLTGNPISKKPDYQKLVRIDIIIQLIIRSRIYCQTWSF